MDATNGVAISLNLCTYLYHNLTETMIKLYLVYSYTSKLYKLCLHTGKANHVGTQTEAGTLAGRQPNARGQKIQQSEGHGGHDGHSQDLLHIQLLLGNDKRGQSYSQTLQEVLYGASYKLGYSKAVHYT